MGKKRKHSKDDDRDMDIILKRVKKLEERLRTRKHHRRSRSPSSSSSMPSSDIENCEPEPVPVLTESPAAADKSVSVAVPSDTPTAEADLQVVENEEATLDEEILALLGDAPKDESPVGPDIHKDVAARLQDTIINGLKKETKDKICEEYLIPGNTQIFKAPLLNAEIKAAVSETLIKKDASIEARQRQIGVVLAALSKAMQLLITERSDSNQVLLKHLSNASRLLCDSHHIDTKLRRSFLVSTLNNKLKDTLKETKRDKFLFGENLAEKLKANKAVNKTSMDLKYPKPKSSVTKVQQQASASSSNNLNWRHPQPNTLNKKPVLSSHRAAGWTPNHQKNQATRRPQTSSAPRTTARYNKNNKRT